MAPRVNKKVIEKYFRIINDKAICKLCSQKLKSDRLFNLKTHMKRVHEVQEKEFSSEDIEIEIKQEEFESIDNSACSFDNNTSKKVKKIKKPGTKIEICKKQLIRSYIGLITEDSIPFNILNSENFKNIINPICDGISEKYGKQIRLNSSNMKKTLKIISDNIRDSIKTEIEQCLLSIKIHSATRLSPNIFGISCQFIQNNEIQSRILGIIELKDPGTLATEILKTLTKYDINLSQIVLITSDNGANMIDTTKTSSDCSHYDDHDPEGNDAVDENKIYLQKIQMFEDASEIHLDDIQICRCAAHIAQLCTLDITKDSDIRKFLLHCRNLVKFIHNGSNNYREMFELKGLTWPQLDCPTRWGSTYTMIMSVKNSKEIFMKYKSKDEHFELNDSFWDFAEAYCVSFEPLQRAIVKFQEEQLHYGDFYAEWLKCKICTEKLLENNDKPFVEKIATKLINCMENRKTKLLNNESLLSCLYLDPRFHHTLTQAQKKDAATYLKKLFERMKSINVHMKESKTDILTSSMETSQFAQKADEYLNDYLTQHYMPINNKYIDVFSKIENLHLPFIRADSNVLQFWKERQYTDPELYDLSNICFAVPTTQGTIERVLSSLKLIVADTRYRIYHGTLENILLVKLNSSFLDEAIETLPLFEDDEKD